MTNPPTTHSLLVVAATRMELACHPGFVDAVAVADAPFALWSAGATEFVECGPGPALAGAGLAWALGRRLPAKVLGIGIAGAFPGSGLGAGTAAWVSQECFGDLGAWDGETWIDFPELSLPGLPAGNRFPLVLPEGAAGVPAVTVSAVTGSVEGAARLRGRCGCDLESMEGAAWALVCRRFGIGLSQARGVSNPVGPRDRSAWKIAEALGALRQLLGA